MEPKDWFSVALAAGSFTVSLGSLAVSLIAYTRTKRTAFGSVELDLVVKFNDASSRMTDVAKTMADIVGGRKPSSLTADEKRHMEALDAIYDLKVEEYLNLFNVACGMYRDHKLDRRRFRIEYEPQLRRLFDDKMPNIRDRVHSLNTPYNAIRAVYQEWFNREV